jgi:uracil-DNA glycosylase
MSYPVCIYCGRSIIEPLGPPKSSIILIGEEPEEDEFKARRPFAGDKLEILTQELSRVGIPITMCRQMNLWPHSITEECPLDKHMDEMAAESKGRDVALVMGASLVRALLGKNVSDVNGLVMESDYLSPSCKVVPCMKVTQSTHGGIGEVRFAIQTLGTFRR